MGRWIGVALAAVLALAAAPAGALAGAGDVSATRSYVQANYTLVQTASSKIKTAEAAIAGLAQRITGECARAAANSPEDPDSEQLSNEVIGAIVLTAYHTEVPAGTRFVRATASLRWSSRGLTNAVQSYVSNIRVLTKLAPPNVCTDVRAWVASGYQTLPANTVRFDQQFMPNWVAIGELPHGLSPFERPDEASIIRRSGQDEYQITEAEANAGVNTWDEIMNTLVLQP
jgi:hypothetical protein